eukprot:5603159-Pyramimonas_sp.AAC.1
MSRGRSRMGSAFLRSGILVCLQSRRSRTSRSTCGCTGWGNARGRANRPGQVRHLHQRHRRLATRPRQGRSATAMSRGRSRRGSVTTPSGIPTYLPSRRSRISRTCCGPTGSTSVRGRALLATRPRQGRCATATS